MCFACDRSRRIGSAPPEVISSVKTEKAVHRRNVLQAALSVLAGLFAAKSARAATEAPASAKLKVVYHLSDLEKVSFVMGNIQNHLDGVGGPDHVTLALVVHGPALKAFHAAGASPDLARHIRQYSKAGLELAACGNTMRAQNVTLNELLPGFVSADKGGVVTPRRIAVAGLSVLAAVRPDGRPSCCHEIVPQWPPCSPHF